MTKDQGSIPSTGGDIHPMPISCPDPTVLQQLLDETAPASVHGELTQHLETCATCRAALDQLAADGASLSGLARGLQQPPTEQEPGLVRVLQDAARTDPAADVTQAPAIRIDTPGGTQPIGARTEDQLLTSAPGMLTEDLAFLSASTEPGQPPRLEH